MKKIIYTLVLIILSTGVYAQKADGSTKSLVNAEKDFAAKLAKDGANAAYAIFAATEGLVFRPNPSNAKTFYSTPESNQKNIAWSPSFAQVSRSGDWGYTTGAYTINTTEKEYGQYPS